MKFISETGVFTEYQPLPEKMISPEVRYLQNQLGQDWYEYISTLSPDTLKLKIDADNVIICVAYDASSLFPENARIVEVDEVDINAFSIGHQKLIEGEIVDVLSIQEKRDQACQLIDIAAGNARKRLSSPGWGIQTEYQHIYQVAVAYLAEEEPEAVPVSVQVHVNKTGLTPEAAADDIVMQYQQAKAVLDKTYEIRINGKEAVKKVVEENPDADLMHIAQQFIDQLNALGV